MAKNLLFTALGPMPNEMRKTNFACVSFPPFFTCDDILSGQVILPVVVDVAVGGGGECIF